MFIEEVRRQLNYCVLDGLLLLTKKYGICGSLADGATEEYAILKEKVCQLYLITNTYILTYLFIILFCRLITVAMIGTVLNATMLEM